MSTRKMQFITFLFAAFIAAVSAFAPAAFTNSRVSRMQMEMKASGKVKFFDSTKGFGFITPDAGGEDVFVHQSAVYAQGFRSLADGEPVEFDISEDPRRGGKKFAVNVTGPGGNYVQGAPRQAKSFNDRGDY